MLELAKNLWTLLKPGPALRRVVFEIDQQWRKRRITWRRL